jgi:hypothetical protein
MRRRVIPGVFWVTLIGLLSVTALLASTVGVRAGDAQTKHADHVRWDIITVQSTLHPRAWLPSIPEAWPSRSPETQAPSASG